jgi:deoxyribose-phosphate aldolase
MRQLMTRSVRIAIGADHGGFETKQGLIPFLTGLGHSVQDVGTNGKDPVDYPRFASLVAGAVSSGKADFGIMIDGAGIGSAMTANKHPGVLAAACYNETLARNAREHNGANLLTLGAGQTGLEDAKKIAAVFLSTEHTAERHIARVNLIKEIERTHMSASMPSNLSPEDVQRIAERVKSMIAGGSPGRPAGGAPIPPEKLCKLIDHTILKADASQADVEKLCKEALQFNFFSVCVNPMWVKLARTLLRGSSVKVCAVVGFPLGAVTPQIKALETRRALRDGAQEIDMVINIGALKSKDDKLVLQDIRGVVEDCNDARALCKVIFENSLLTDEEKVRACELSMKGGAHYVKTSTGMSTGGATAEDIALMARVTAPKKLGVKASGGVRTYADVIKMVNAGATRVGCSSSVKIMEEAKALAGK